MEDFDEFVKKAGKKNVFTHEEIENIAANTKYDLRTRALFVTLYLSNSRVSEIIKRVQKKQVVFTRLDGREDRPLMLFKGLWTNKNRKHPSRVIPINMLREAALITVLRAYLDKLPSNESVLFNFSRQWAWKLLKDMTGQRCHLLRHSRISHLVADYGTNLENVRILAGWSDQRMLSVYAHLSWQDTARSMFV